MAIVNGYRIKGWAKPYRAAMLALVALLVPLPSSDAMPPLRVAFSEDADSIVVGEIEPGSEVLYLEVSRSVGAWVRRTSTRSELARDEDKDSEVRIPIEGDVPAKLFAVAVETASGRFGILAPDTPEGVPAREIAFPADAFGEGPERRFDRLDDHADLTAILLVRPGDGGGAWSRWSRATALTRAPATAW